MFKILFIYTVTVYSSYFKINLIFPWVYLWG